MSAPSAHTCPTCGAASPEPVVLVENTPALCNSFAATATEAIAMPRGDIELVVCGGCGMLWNRVFDPALAPYDSAYENSLHFSPRFQAFAEELAQGLAARCSSPGGTVVEIGAGAGDFLGMLAARGFGEAIGLDPSLRSGAEWTVGSAVVRLLPGSFQDAPAGTSADLVVCRHVLEHVRDPVGLLAGARSTVAHAGTALYVEVPDATHMLTTPAVWDLVYEHVGYFTAAALTATVTAAGWEVKQHGRSFGGQYLWVEAVAPSAVVPSIARSDAGATSRLAGRFAASRTETLLRWGSFVRSAATADRRLAVWGAGSKGVTFLNTFPELDALVIDVNPRKQGRFVPGTGAPVVAVEEAVDRVDTVLVMNPLYVDEVRARCAALGIAADFMVVEG